MRSGPAIIGALGLVSLALAAARSSSSSSSPGGDSDSDADAAFAFTQRVLVEPLRRAVPSLRVTSGLRSESANEAAGGAKDSQHLHGQAVDVVASGYTAEELLEVARSLGLPIDQAIAYAPSRGGHLHLSTRADGRNRGQLLVAPSDGGYRPYVSSPPLV